jgi:hypothetical protein
VHYFPTPSSAPYSSGTPTVTTVVPTAGPAESQATDPWFPPTLVTWTFSLM